MQPLPYQYGIEARALESLWELFALARQAMKENAGCERFSHLTATMLNVDLRPLTAKWHRAHKAGLLDSKDGANEFRADLAQLRPKLVDFARQLQMLAYGAYRPDEQTPPVIGNAEIEACFARVSFGVSSSRALPVPRAADINAAESAEIDARRRNHRIDRPSGLDAVGMSLSGVGIRSATFCLGVVQVLAERGLMKDFDYLSTVSGGGYTGSFITSHVGRGADFEALGHPRGPDTEPIRHLRKNAKYLAASDLKHQWLMVAGTLAGLLLNLTGPIALLCALAWAILKVDAKAEWLLWSAQGVGGVTLVLVAAYGMALRSRVGTRWGRAGFAWGLALTGLALAGYAAAMGFHVFMHLIESPWTVSGVVLGAVCTVVVVSLILRLLAKPSTHRLILQGLLIVAGCLVPLLAVTGVYLLCLLGLASARPGAMPLDPLRYVDGATLLALLAPVLGLCAVFLVNVNLTGLHRLYRDQLAKTFVQVRDTDPDLPLPGINPLQLAPYHLVNATVNLPTSANRTLRDRRGDFFMFSKCWSGAPATGYRPTAEWPADGAPLDLATVMAISGAAAALQMGLGSMPALSGLLSLLNVRLNFWLGNPGRKPAAAPGFVCLLREILGTGMSEASKWLNLSDGGHIENMGVYELLRRRCKFMSSWSAWTEKRTPNSCSTGR